VLIGVACLSVLGTAAALTPSHNGMGTHEALGLNACQFLQRTGIPCPSCGMTTAFSLVMHGRVLSAAYVQPFGALLAFAAIVAVWVAGYVAVTGRPVYRMAKVVGWERWILPALLLATAAWGWKIVIHVTGHDGF
jgi:hypothetical protein